jgi:hypothetical protein
MPAIGDPFTTPANETGAVLTLLSEQASLYERLESLAERQRTLVSDDDVSPLFELLADRQRLSEQLLRIGGCLGPVRREWSSFRSRLTTMEQAEADRLWNEAGNRLRRVMESDERDTRVLSGRRQAVAAALGTSQATGQAMSAYRAPVAALRVDCTDEVE